MLSTQRYFIKESIFLIGFMGSGKTSIAKLLSQQTGIPFKDTDKEIVQLSKQTVSEIINNQGEQSFRKFEAEVLQRLLDGPKQIIATGGGCVESAVSRGILKNCFCVWLDVDAKNSSERIEDFSQRPMFKDIENAENLIDKRKDTYSQYADIKIDTNNKSLSDVCAELLQALIKADVLQY